MTIHALGVNVFPTEYMRKKGAVRWKPLQRTSVSQEQVATWFGDTDNSQLGIGVICGQVSGGLLVRDFDRRLSYEAWRARHRDLAAALPTVQTARGAHVWFRCRDYPRSPKGSFVRRFSDGELRGDSHIAIAPPSLSARSGEPYRWLVFPRESIPFAELTDFIDTQALRANVTHVVSELPSAASSAAPSSSCLPARPPLREWETGGSDRSRAKTLADAIKHTLPRARGQRNRCIFEFARYLKGLDGYRDADADVLGPEFRRWHEAATPFIGTKDFSWNFAEFVRAWSQVQVPAGIGSLANAVVRAKVAGTIPGTERLRAPELRLLVALCRELQIERGDEPFFLACRDAADAIGLISRSPAPKEPHVTAWRWLQMLCHLGILRKVGIGSKKDRRANEYRYLGFRDGPPTA